MLDGPIPGESLTQDPAAPQDYETPPTYTSLEPFMDDMFLNLTDDDNIDGVLDAVRKKVPVEDVAQMLLFQAQASGKITTDLMLSAVEPTIYRVIGIATYAEVENPVLYPEDPMQDDPEDEIAMLDKEGEEVTLENVPVPKGLSKSLVAKIKDGDI